MAERDVAAQEAALAQLQQALPPLQKQREQTRNLLAALPNDDPEERFAGLELLSMSLLLVGWVRDVVMLNPRTGNTAVCPASSLNPWSQQQARVGDHSAQGWRRPE